MSTEPEGEHSHKAEGCECGLSALPDHVMAQVIFERDGTVRAARNGVSRKHIAYALRLLADAYDEEQAKADAEAASLEALLSQNTYDPEEPTQ